MYVRQVWSKLLKMWNLHVNNSILVVANFKNVKYVNIKSDNIRDPSKFSAKVHGDKFSNWLFDLMEK